MTLHFTFIVPPCAFMTRPVLFPCSFFGAEVKSPCPASCSCVKKCFARAGEMPIKSCLIDCVCVFQVYCEDHKSDVISTLDLEGRDCQLGPLCYQEARDRIQPKMQHGFLPMQAPSSGGKGGAKSGRLSGSKQVRLQTRYGPDNGTRLPRVWGWTNG